MIRYQTYRPEIANADDKISDLSTGGRWEPMISRYINGGREGNDTIGRLKKDAEAPLASKK